MANIGFISLGCAKNQVDCERMMYRIQQAGHTVCAGVAGCDVVVINTCGFIDSAKAEAIDNILEMAELKNQQQQEIQFHSHLTLVAQVLVPCWIQFCLPS